MHGQNNIRQSNNLFENLESKKKLWSGNFCGQKWGQD